MKEAELNPHGPVPELQPLTTTQHLNGFWAYWNTFHPLNTGLHCKLCSNVSALQGANIQICFHLLHLQLYFHTKVLQFSPVFFLPSWPEFLRKFTHSLLPPTFFSVIIWFNFSAPFYMTLFLESAIPLGTSLPPLLVSSQISGCSSSQPQVPMKLCSSLKCCGLSGLCP